MGQTACLRIFVTTFVPRYKSSRDTCTVTVVSRTPCRHPVVCFFSLVSAVCLCTDLFMERVYLSACLCVSICLPVCLCACVFVYVSMCLCLCVCVYVSRMAVFISLCRSRTRPNISCVFFCVFFCEFFCEFVIRLFVSLFNFPL